MSGNFRLLVLGAGRSGTSLLACFLDCHSRWRVSLEASKHELERGDLAGFRAKCDRAADSARPRLWGNKLTTEQLAWADHGPDFFDRFFNQALAGVPVLTILRDGRACVASKVKRKGLSVEEACRKWKYAVTVCRFLQEERANHLVVRFEDLLLNTRPALERVCEFLGISWEQQMLDAVQSERMPEKYRYGFLDRSKAETAPPERFLHLREIEEELRWCGYLGPGPSSCP